MADPFYLLQLLSTTLYIQVMYLVFSPILWFENLALADPFYLLQLLISTTLYPGGKKSGR